MAVGMNISTKTLLSIVGAVLVCVVFAVFVAVTRSPGGAPEGSLSARFQRLVGRYTVEQVPLQERVTGIALGRAAARSGGAREGEPSPELRGSGQPGAAAGMPKALSVFDERVPGSPPAEAPSGAGEPRYSSLDLVAGETGSGRAAQNVPGCVEGLAYLDFFGKCVSLEYLEKNPRCASGYRDKAGIAAPEYSAAHGEDKACVPPVSREEVRRWRTSPAAVEASGLAP